MGLFSFLLFYRNVDCFATVAGLLHFGVDFRENLFSVRKFADLFIKADEDAARCIGMVDSAMNQDAIEALHILYSRKLAFANIHIERVFRKPWRHRFHVYEVSPRRDGGLVHNLAISDSPFVHRVRKLAVGVFKRISIQNAVNKNASHAIVFSFPFAIYQYFHVFII